VLGVRLIRGCQSTRRGGSTKRRLTDLGTNRQTFVSG
jgi:hypothetical protein